jgi:hypothetical protein
MVLLGVLDITSVITSYSRDIDALAGEKLPRPKLVADGAIHISEALRFSHGTKSSFQRALAVDRKSANALPFAHSSTTGSGYSLLSQCRRLARNGVNC